MNRSNLQKRARIVLPRVLQQASRLRIVPARVEVEVSLVGRLKMTSLNSEYRRKRGPTDVLSFPAPQTVARATGFLGEIVICAEVLRKQAREQGHGFEVELVVLMVHGLLHLLGYDHERSAQARREMARRERQLLRHLKRFVPGLVGRGTGTSSG